MSERFRVICLALVMALLQACSWPEAPPRPPNVPLDAERLGGWKVSWWVKCSYRSGVDVCTVFNSRGLMLWDSVYRPYDGGPPVLESELRIDLRHSDFQELHLKNGRILIQERVFDEVKRAIELQRDGKR